MGKELPDFDLMKAYYPTDHDPQKVKRDIGKDVNQDHYKNTCVIRISRAFNYANHPIPADTAKFRTKQGADGKWYGLRVSEFRDYMIATYGKPTFTERIGKKTPIDYSKFAHCHGILCLAVDGWSDATGHFTIWWEDHMLYGEPNYLVRANEALLWTTNTRYYTPEV